MEEQFRECINYFKNTNIDACITGSGLLEYFPESQQDVDIFCYSEAAFIDTVYTLYHNPMYTILDKVELWKFESIRNGTFKSGFKKLQLLTIKFTYNLCIPVNIIFKDRCTNAFSVLESFDMNIICKAYDIPSKQYLDLTDGSTVTKIASFNKWNKSFYSENIWSISRALRQFERTTKYYLRNYDTDPMVLKYIDLLEKMLEYENIFTSSEKMDDKMVSIKHNVPILIQIFQQWLQTHSITPTELELIKSTIKNL